jgi:hypothetical protein
MKEQASRTELVLADVQSFNKLRWLVFLEHLEPRKPSSLILDCLHSSSFSASSCKEHACDSLTAERWIKGLLSMRPGKNLCVPMKSLSHRTFFSFTTDEPAPHTGIVPLL